MARKKRLTANNIINKVEAHHEATEPLRRRMELDFQLYRLERKVYAWGYEIC